MHSADVDKKNHRITCHVFSSSLCFFLGVAQGTKRRRKGGDDDDDDDVPSVRGGKSMVVDFLAEVLVHEWFLKRFFWLDVESDWLTLWARRVCLHKEFLSTRFKCGEQCGTQR